MPISDANSLHEVGVDITSAAVLRDRCEQLHHASSLGAGLEDCLAVASPALLLRFEDDATQEGLQVEPWVLERFEYFQRLLAGGFSEATRGEARLPCRRSVFEAFLMLARSHWTPASIDLMMRMEVLRIADMLSEGDIVRLLADSIRVDYLTDGDGARDSTVMVLCELADLLAPVHTGGNPLATASSSISTQAGQLAPTSPSPAAIWLVATTAVTPAPIASNPAVPSSPPASQSVRPESTEESGDPLRELREACLGALPPWTRQRFAEKPQVWRLRLEDVLDVYGAEASPRAESSWLALHATRRFCPDILPFASVDNEDATRLIQDHPEMVIRRCISLCIRELPFSKSVQGFGGTSYQIQVALNAGQGGGWVLGIGGQGLCALRKVVLEIEGRPGGERHELGFTGLMEHASGRQEDGVLGFASGVQHTSLPFAAKLTIFEYPLHLAVQTYIGLNFNTMALLSQGFDFGPMDLACVMDLWLQSDQLRRVPEVSIAEVVKRTLRFVKLEWAPVVRISFIVCMHSCWTQAKHIWWHNSLIWSCMELQVWRGPSDGKPGAGTFRSYVAQIMQHALSPHPEIFIAALQEFVEGLPPITLESIEAFFSIPDSISDPMAIVARHYLQLLRVEDQRSNRVSPSRESTDASKGDDYPSDFGAASPVSVPGASSCPDTSSYAGGKGVGVSELQELLRGLWRMIGPMLEQAEPRTAVLSFAALAALCDLRHQRRLCAESLRALQVLEGRPPDGPEARFWASCFFTLLEFTQTLRGRSEVAREGTSGAAVAGQQEAVRPP